MSSIPQVPAGALFQPWVGVFETLRVDQGKPRFVEEHWQSLQEACAVLEIGSTVDFRTHRSSLPRKTGRWRWVVTAGESRHFFQPDEGPVTAQFRAEISPVRVGSENWDARWKTLSYLTHWQARQMASAHEALVQNERGDITGGAMTNLFWVKDGKVFTPRLTSGCRNGVLRRWVAGQMPVTEKRLTLAVLNRADELFLTNSWIGIRPLVGVAGRKWPVGPLTKQLQTALRNDCRK